MRTIGILVFDDVEELDFVGPLEVFALASLSLNLKVLTVAETPDEIRCRYGLRMIPSCSFRDCPPLDLLIVPGGPGARNQARSSPAILEFVPQTAGFCRFRLHRRPGSGCRRRLEERKRHHPPQPL